MMNFVLDCGERVGSLFQEQSVSGKQKQVPNRPQQKKNFEEELEKSFESYEATGEAIDVNSLNKLFRESNPHSQEEGLISGSLDKSDRSTVTTSTIDEGDEEDDCSSNLNALNWLYREQESCDDEQKTRLLSQHFQEEMSNEVDMILAKVERQFREANEQISSSLRSSNQEMRGSMIYDSQGVLPQIADRQDDLDDSEHRVKLML